MVCPEHGECSHQLTAWTVAYPSFVSLQSLFKVYAKVPFYLYLANTKKYSLLRICSSIYVAQLENYCLLASVFIKELKSAVGLASLSQ
jgi:hypothetical protein